MIMPVRLLTSQAVSPMVSLFSNMNLVLSFIQIILFFVFMFLLFTVYLSKQYNFLLLSETNYKRAGCK